MIDIGGGVMSPHYELTDPQQNSIGIADPDGWRENIGSSAGRVPWTDVKRLYR
jgi:hypothetical protein